MANNNAQLVAILSYITPIGWIIALILHLDKKTSLGGFHLRQGLIILAASVLISWIRYINWILGIILFILWIMGLVSAVKGTQKVVPLIGKFGQEWFKGL